MKLKLENFIDISEPDDLFHEWFWVPSCFFLAFYTEAWVKLVLG